MRNLDKVKPFVRAGCLLQITAGSVTSRFGPHVQQSARRMLEQGRGFVVSTDAHNLQYGPPDLVQGHDDVERLLGAEEAMLLTRRSPAGPLGTPMPQVRRAMLNAAAGA